MAKGVLKIVKWGGENCFTSLKALYLWSWA